MIKNKLGIFLVIWTLGVFASCDRPPSDEAKLFAAAQLIRPEALRAHTEFLADDALEGRGTGTRGHDLAAKYLRAQFAALGLRGGVQDGGFFQDVPFVRAEVNGEATTFKLVGRASSRDLVHGADYYLIDTQARPQVDFAGPIVFAGFGISAPELDHDDYAGLDVTNKVVAILRGAPSSFPSTLRAYCSAHDIKRRNAAAHGAAGVIEVRTPAEESRSPWQLWIDSWPNEGRWLDASGRPHGLDDRIRFWAVLNLSGGEALFSGEAYSFEDVSRASTGSGEVPTFALAKTVAVRFAGRTIPARSANVIALLEGTDEERMNEYLVLSSHADHLGIGRPVDGDAIYNGALDNAVGCAVLVEVAGAFRAAEMKPRRSIFFLITTGEEAGFLGSEYFAWNPPVPEDRIVANINVDGSGASLFLVEDIVLYGREHTSLGPLAEKVAEEAGLKVSPDPWPDEVMFVRQDAYPFILKGVPSLYVDSGYKSMDPRVDGLALLKKWMITVYHSPKDDMDQVLDFESGARFSRFVFRLSHAVADGAERPSWNKGDLFGEKTGARVTPHD